MTTRASTKMGVAGGGRASVLVLGVMVVDPPMHEVLSCDDPHHPVVLVGCVRREERCGSGEFLCAGSSKASGSSGARARRRWWVLMIKWRRPMRRKSWKARVSVAVGPNVYGQRLMSALRRGRDEERG
jgi:hypothetical protein